MSQCTHKIGFGVSIGNVFLVDVGASSYTQAG